MDRKEFFKKIVHSIGDNVSEKLSEVQRNFEDEINLSADQKAFLLEYSAWLTEFQYFVKKREENVFDVENNKKLMALSAEAEKRKPTLELLMKDSLFLSHFNTITREISEAIS